MQLHYFPGTIAVTVAIILEEVGLDYEPILVNFKSAEQTNADYLAINPKGRVPTLNVDGTLLTETGAILDYIAAIRPDADLVPNDPLDAAHMRAVMYYLASTLHVNHAHKMRGPRWANNPDSHADMAAKVPETMTDAANHVESHCLRGTFAIGDQFTLADAYLFNACLWLDGDGVDISAFPRILAHRAAMESRASVQAVRSKGILA